MILNIVLLLVIYRAYDHELFASCLSGQLDDLFAILMLDYWTVIRNCLGDLIISSETSTLQWDVVDFDVYLTTLS